MLLNTKKYIFSLPILFISSVLAAPVDYQSHESISQSAIQHMQTLLDGQYADDLSITSGRLDKRLKLHICEQALEAFLPTGAKETGNTTVGVRCNGNKPWTLYVPIKVSYFGQVLVTSKALSKGSINKLDFKLARRDLAKLSRGYMQNPYDVLGKKLKYPLGIGTVIRPDMLEMPHLIKRGQRVTIISGNAGLQVRMPGKALANGAAGARIRVENLSSKRIIEGLITQKGQVRVGR